MTSSNRQAQYVQRTGGSFHRQRFNIEGSPEAYRILSSGLYSNKITAIIRELSTNAVDSHLVAGNPDPFEVHLPSYDEPWFTVCDFGTGLSHDDVMHLYSTYFGTNKRDDEKTTGCLGLGSKSPLSKTRSFTVISRHDGVERHYVVALNEDRIPEVNYLEGQDKPTVSTGMEIHMAVSVGDIKEFTERANEVFYYFRPELRPRVVNGKDYKVVEHDVVLEGDGWRILNSHTSAVAVQGNIGYPITSNCLQHVDDPERYLSLLNCHLEVDFPNGTLSFTPSREHLSYNRSTCNAIVQRLDEILDDINNVLSQRLSSCQSLWEARCLAWSMFWANDAQLKKLRQFSRVEELTWQGQPITGKYQDFGHLDGITAWKFEVSSERRNRYWSNDDNTPKPVVRKEATDYVPLQDAVWCEADIPRGVYSRCTKYVKDNPTKKVYLVEFADRVARDDFCNLLGLTGTEFIPVSSLPKPDVKRGESHSSTSLVYVHKGQLTCHRHYEYWTETKINLDDDDGGIYVPMKHNQVVGEDGKLLNPGIVGSLTRLCRELLGENITVYGVRPQLTKKFQKSDDWVNVFAYVRKLLQLRNTKDNLFQNIVDARCWSQFGNRFLWESMVSYNTHFNGLSAKHSILAMLTACATLKKTLEEIHNYGKWQDLCGLLKVNNNCTPTYNLDALEARCLVEVPLLGSIFNLANLGYRPSLSSNFIQQISHHVLLVERHKKI
jgi:hypothetical protein